MRYNVYCDHCAEDLTGLPELEGKYFISKMPVDFDSGLAGESAVLCESCFVDYFEMEDYKEEKEV